MDDVIFSFVCTKLHLHGLVALVTDIRVKMLSLNPGAFICSKI